MLGIFATIARRVTVWLDQRSTFPDQAYSDASIKGPSESGADVDTRFRDLILRAGLNYTFGGPVVAKY